MFSVRRVSTDLFRERVFEDLHELLGELLHAVDGVRLS